GTINFSEITVDVNAIKLYDTNSASVQTAATAAQVTGTTSLTGTAGFGSGTGTANFSGTNEVKITLTTSAGANDITLNASTLASAAVNLAAVTTEEFISAINNQIAASSNIAGTVTAALDTSGRLSFTTTGAGATETVSVANGTVTVGNTLVDVGFGTGTAGTDTRSGAGTAAGTTTARGILDTVSGAFSVDSIDISALTGTAGDASLKAIITQVDKAISAVTNAGTKLGANKTQIDGQKTFVDTLMKANDRTIGILVDADIEEESTKLKALQTQQQLAVQSLSIANSSSQSILSLFR
ncbi:flagellin, partial [Methylobacterium sp. Leaf466]|uniref:flagellin n=1 Tax=Methylobacterium sp. Leaf466 TaxID=1736386 RepID=UPI000A592F21